jgi:hypothetical protein
MSYSLINTKAARLTLFSAVVLSLGLAFAPTAIAAALGSEEEDNPAFNGKRLLGVDISDVDLNYPAIQDFLGSLSPDRQRGVIGACLNQASWGAASRVDARTAVAPFCSMAVIAAGQGG